MSLKVTDELVGKAQAGELSDDDLIGAIRMSLPFAYATIEQLVASLHRKRFALVAPGHMEESDRGQLLRLFASTAMRRALERRFGISLAFQNCHSAAAVWQGDEGWTEYQFFCSGAGQILNQRPELVDC